MIGTGLGHYIPLATYLGFAIMSLVSLSGRPLLGFYYMIPFLPYRTLRDKFLDYPLGANMLTILIIAIIVGALLHGKSLPKSRLYVIWLVFGTYLYISMWLGTMLGNAPPPLWLSDANFSTWKDYMVIPLIFIAAGLVIEDRKAIRTTILITAITVALIDRTCILESMSRSWSSFDESKRDGGPLAYGSNQTAAFLAQFAMFFWGFSQFIKRIKLKLCGYIIVAATIFAAMYTFSRAGYLAMLFGVFVLALLKDRKLLIVLGIFLLTWQTVVPTAVRERVNMTESSNGRLEASAQERVDLWSNAEQQILHSPVVGNGFASFQFGQHVDNLKDTHNLYVKILVETGLVGLVIVIFMFKEMLTLSYKLFKRTTDPLYRGLGLGLFMAMCACLVANCFGDRWTYLEITSLLWVLTAAALRATMLFDSVGNSPTADITQPTADNPYLAYR